MKYSDGRVYEGEFKDWMPHGRGILKYLNGRVDEGEFKNGQIQVIQRYGICLVQKIRHILLFPLWDMLIFKAKIQIIFGTVCSVRNSDAFEKTGQ